MIKKNFLHAGMVVILTTVATGQSQAANVNAATASSPTQILINHAVAKTASGIKHIRIRLVARDSGNLHEHQIYQAHFSGASSSAPQDGSYDETDDEIFIPRLLQNGSGAHQTTLRLVNRKTLEFEVTETTFVSSESNPNLFFDPNAIHDVIYHSLDK